MVVTSSKEPIWAYPEPSRGRRLHNERVHLGPQFLVGSSGQPLLPSAIPSTLSTTGCPSPVIGQRPPANGHSSFTSSASSQLEFRLSDSSIFVSVALHRILQQFHAREAECLSVSFSTHELGTKVPTPRVLKQAFFTLLSFFIILLSFFVTPLFVLLHAPFSFRLPPSSPSLLVISR